MLTPLRGGLIMTGLKNLKMRFFNCLIVNSLLKIKIRDYVKGCYDRKTM